MSENIIILDRDGVINQDSDGYIKNETEWLPIPGSIEAIVELSKAGFTVCVATNQSGLARGLFDEFDLARMHEFMCTLVENAGGRIDAIFYCPHGPDDGCDCRKPKTGLLDQMEQLYAQPVAGAWYIGDTDKDISAALSKQCKPILVLTGKGALTRKALTPEKLSDIPVFKDLSTAARFVISEQIATV